MNSQPRGLFGGAITRFTEGLAGLADAVAPSEEGAEDEEVTIREELEKLRLENASLKATNLARGANVDEIAPVNDSENKTSLSQNDEATVVTKAGLCEITAELREAISTKDHEIASLKEVIHQLRRNKNTRAQEAEMALKDQKVLIEELRTKSERAEELLARNECLEAALAANEQSNRAFEEKGQAEAELRSQLAEVRAKFDNTRQLLDDATSRSQVLEADLAVATADCERSKVACVNLQRVLVRILTQNSRPRAHKQP